MEKRKRVFKETRLRQIREDRGYTQDELAMNIGLGQSQMNKYENGKSEPSPEIIKRIAQELGVSADYLIGLVDEPTQTFAETATPNERKILLAMRRGDYATAMKLMADELKQNESSDLPHNQLLLST